MAAAVAPAAKLISGTAISAAITDELAVKVKDLVASTGRQPGTLFVCVCSRCQLCFTLTLCECATSSSLQGWPWYWWATVPTRRRMYAAKNACAKRYAVCASVYICVCVHTELHLPIPVFSQHGLLFSIMLSPQHELVPHLPHLTHFFTSLSLHHHHHHHHHHTWV
jgi:hypothetical protein